MLEILQFIFQGFWHFLGTMILLGIISDMIVKIIRGYSPREEEEDEK